MDAAISSFAGNLAASLATRAVSAFATGIVDLGRAAITQAGKIEDLVTQIGTLTGSAEDAKKILGELQQFAATTPFQLEGLAQSTKLLLAFGNAQEDIIPTLQVLGDVAAGSGNDLIELTRIFGQIQSEGKLTGERFKQLAERAVPIGPAIAKAMGVAETSVKRLISEGKVDLQIFTEAFNSLNKVGGTFADGMIRQSKTLSGVLSTLNDNIDLVLADIGNELLPVIKEYATLLITAIQNNKEFIKSFAQGTLEVIGGIVSWVSQQITDLVNKVIFGINIFKGLGDILTGDVAKGFRLMTTGVRESTEELAANKKAVDDNIAAQKRIDAVNKEIISGINEKRAAEKAAALEAQARLIKAEEAKVAQRAAEIAEEEKHQENLLILKRTVAEVEAQEALALRELMTANRDEEKIEEQDFLTTRLEELALLKLDAQIAEQTALGNHLAALDLMREKDALKESQKVKKGSLEFVKISKARKDFSKKNWNTQVSDTADGLDGITSLMKSENKIAFKIGKAAAIAQAAIRIPETAIKAFNSLAGIPIVGPALGAIAAAAAVAAGIMQIQKIKSTPPPSFAEGGIVPGTSFSGDSVSARVNSGEMILNQQQQSNLFDSINEGSAGGATINVQGNIIADNDEQVQTLIERINDSIQFSNSVLRV